ncbi:unnamed protein product [Prorocentrum cordatum]|uniref:Transcription initiation factor IIF subunit alpha n=1 Tax=Prorocentrum cordatum TaxID=2364126 RepID=A0ABN9SAM6_9DINO|nr:unnamed protein product [Polarella glacialis]
MAPFEAATPPATPRAGKGSAAPPTPPTTAAASAVESAASSAAPTPQPETAQETASPPPETAQETATESTRAVCTDVELLTKVLRPVMTKPDFVVYKSDHSSFPVSSDQAPLSADAAVLVAQSIRQQAAPNLSVGKVACENAIEFLVTEKAKTGKPPWSLFEGDSKKRYVRDMTARVRTLRMHAGSFYRRKLGPPQRYKAVIAEQGYTDGINLNEDQDEEEGDADEEDSAPVRRRPSMRGGSAAGGEDEPEGTGAAKKRPAAAKPAGDSAGSEVQYVYRFDDNKNSAVRTQPSTRRVELCDSSRSSDQGGFMVATWADGKEWRYPEALHQQKEKPKSATSGLPSKYLPDGSKVYVELKRDRDPNHKLILIMRKLKDGTKEQQTQATTRHFDNEEHGAKVMTERVLEMFVRDPKTTKQQAMAAKMDLLKEIEKTVEAICQKEAEKLAKQEADAAAAPKRGAAARKRPAAAKPANEEAAASDAEAASGNGMGENAEAASDGEVYTAGEGEADAAAGGAPSTPEQKGKGKKRAAPGKISTSKVPIQRIGIEKGITGAKASKSAQGTSPQTAIKGPTGTLMGDARKQLAEDDSSDGAE